MTRLLIRNGRVVDPSQGLDEGMDLLIEDGCVAALGERLETTADTVVLDAAKLVVAPGFNDEAMEADDLHRILSLMIEDSYGDGCYVG